MDIHMAIGGLAMSIHPEGQQDNEGEAPNGQQRVGQHREQGGGCRGWLVRDWGTHEALYHTVCPQPLLQKALQPLPTQLTAEHSRLRRGPHLLGQDPSSHWPLTFWAPCFRQVGEALVAEVAFTAAEIHLGVLLGGHTLLPEGRVFLTPLPAGQWRLSQACANSSPQTHVIDNFSGTVGPTP